MADVIATGVNDQPGRWGPRDARRVALGVSAAALAAGAVFILRSGPPWTDPALAAAAIGAALLIAAAAVARAAGDSRAGAVLGYAAVPYAFLAGLLIPARSLGLAHLGATALLSAFAAAALAAVVAAVASAEVPLFFGLAVASLLGVVGAWLGLAFGLGFDGAAAVVAVPTLALTPLIPLVSFRMARMTLPQVPRHADDLRRDTLAVRRGRGVRAHGGGGPVRDRRGGGHRPGGRGRGRGAGLRRQLARPGDVRRARAARCCCGPGCSAAWPSGSGC